MEIDMSAEAVTNRLKTMEQLWELSVNLMSAKDISEAKTDENPNALDRKDAGEIETRKHYKNISPIN